MTVENVYTLRGYEAASLAGTRQRLPRYAEQAARLLAKPPAPDRARELLDNELERARFANALGETEILADALSAAASYAAAMAVRARLPAGEIRLSLGGAGEVRLPPGPSGATPAAWLDGLCCAMAVRGPEAIAVLAQPETSIAVQQEAKQSQAVVGSEPFWPHYADAFIALLRQDPLAAEHARLAVNAIENGPTGVLDPVALHSVDRRVLELISLLALGQTANWRAALNDAINEFNNTFSDSESAFLPIGFLPLGLLALSAVAFERDQGLPETTAYLPPGIVDGSLGLRHTIMQVRYADLAVLSADEAHWFLDLQGYPRKARAHHLLMEGSTPIASYTLPAGGGLPKAEARFILAETLEDSSRLALDAGELIYLAEAFAREVGAGSTTPHAQQLILLDDAINCVDAALQRLPKDGSVLPPSQLPSRCGREIYDAEPGRFRRTRMTAYRDGLKGLLRHMDTHSEAKPQPAMAEEGSDSTTGENHARATAHAVSAIVRAEALVVIQALASDYDGKVRESLRPRDEDYDKVFVGASAARARKAYDKVWSRGLNMDFPASSYSEIVCDVAPAGMLAERNELSRRFPGGYVAIAEKLNPHRIWVAWQYRRPGEDAGLAYDGLVWIDDHWSWFPKPYRHLAV
ncbi:MAG: immunity 49 family protein [Candidatus Thiodiazotropha sp. (ex Dulcina madagascariensis)]|nr:immunity 49 family protein [Candidatus Thiodiazotropha sp. (ex Dulcina madagascariensis)]MCU7925875.1 immunity 49 family protein [Candidatus Thiodiazotropha sp. (ex Dulcina madagascariensis)]